MRWEAVSAHRRGRRVLQLAALAGVGALVARRRRRHGGYRNRCLFSLGYFLCAAVAERGELGRRRQALLANARGLILDVGSGTGENLKHVSASARGLIALEPDAVMARLARRRLAEARVPARLVRAVVEDLPFPDATFDTAAVTLVLCSVEEPPRAVAELRRVLRPGGRLLLLEHVRSSDRMLAEWQDRLVRPWAWLNGGCRPNRPTMETIKASGFRLDDLKRYGTAALPHVEAVAAREPHV